MKKRKLYLDDEEEYLPLAIVAPVEEYRLCFFLNKHLELDLDRCGEVIVSQGSPPAPHAYPAYMYEDPEGGFLLRLFSNRAEGRYLVPRLKGVDYLLLLSGIEAEEALKRIGDTLRKLALVQSSFPIEKNLLTHISLES
jgi:hypothetical protein